MTHPIYKRLSDLHESEERFRSLTELSADGYWEQDEQLRFRAFWNPSSREIEPRRAEQLLGKKRWELEHINLSEADWAAHRALLGPRQPLRELELCRCEAGGRRVGVRVRGEPIFNAAGVFKG